jgi:formylglycine-generating enzyme required for sulfatase activity
MTTLREFSFLRRRLALLVVWMALAALATEYCPGGERRLLPEVRARRYILSLAAAIKTNAHDRVVSLCEEIFALAEFKVEPGYHFFYGRSLLALGREDEGREVLEEFLSTPGLESYLIDEALSLLDNGFPKQALQGEPETLEIVLGDGVSMRMKRLPAGTFLMGSSETEGNNRATVGERWDNEKMEMVGERNVAGRDADEVQHEVTLTKPFYLGIYEVTQEQWRAVMGNNPSYFKGDKRPVEMVSWDEANEFCRRASEKTGRRFRLPTEAEWEYACRGGTATAFHTGNTINTNQANYDGNYVYGDGVKGVRRRETVEVGRFPANAWGLHDMHGNVWEWCSDWYGEYPPGRQSDPKGPVSGEYRVLRGGSWINSPRYCRSAYRYRYGPGGRGSDFGCRLVLD